MSTVNIYFLLSFSSRYEEQCIRECYFAAALCASNVLAGAASPLCSYYPTFEHEMFMTRPIILLIMEFKEQVGQHAAL